MWYFTSGEIKFPVPVKEKEISSDLLKLNRYLTRSIVCAPGPLQCYFDAKQMIESEIFVVVVEL